MLIIGVLNLGIGNFDWDAIELALLVQIGILAGIISLGHFFVGNPELRKNFSLLGMFSLCGGVALLTAIVLYFSVLSVISLVRFFSYR